MENRIVLITNVEHFVGRPVAAELAAMGATVVCHDESFADSAAAERFAAANPALSVVGAQTPGEIVAAATERCGRVDVVICNDAGAAIRAPIERASVDDMRSALEEMVVFPFLIASAAVPQMKERKRGKILFITSATPLRGLPNYSMYVTARGATNALTVSLAQELGRDNIQVNAIAPNYVESPTYFPPELVNDPDTFAKMTRNIPLKRLGKPEEVAALVAFYASDKSDFITGHVMPFAGGWA
ncbi:MAG: SDR family oxidoreductase [Rhodospirillaceae bacterium]|nr:SDR family oxidoreductase [Rhodospirillaceae bacterium]